MSELNYTKVPSRINSGKFQFCSQKTKIVQNKKKCTIFICWYILKIQFLKSGKFPSLRKLYASKNVNKHIKLP